MQDIIFQLIIEDIIENDICNVFKIVNTCSNIYDLIKPILADSNSLLSKKIKIITKYENDMNSWFAVAQIGHKDIIEFFIEKNANYLYDLSYLIDLTRRRSMKKKTD